MADEGTLGLVRAQEHPAEELSKADLQRRLDETRDSISHTVTEIKETVANQVQAVKETLDWREQFKKRPVAWSVGAMGVGFLAGYGIAAALKGKDGNERAADGEQARAYAAGPILGEPGSPLSHQAIQGDAQASGPGVFRRIADSGAFDKVRQEAATVGDLFVRELGNTAKLLVVPAVIKSIKNFVGGYLPTDLKRNVGSADLPKSERSSYQPKLEHNQGS